MKDLKFPHMSREERAKAFKELQVGDTIAEIKSYGWNNDYYVISRKIIRKTPKGYLRLDDGMLLKNFYISVYFTLTDKFKEWSKNNLLENDTWDLINKVSRNERDFRKNITCEDALKLKEILERTLEVKGNE